METDGRPIAELELQFAERPDSDAFIPLAEAYLRDQRLMEATVVCKKGLKSHPQRLDARLLMARILRAQRKFPRALEQVEQALQAHPEAADALAMRGRLRLDRQDGAGVEDLRAAYDRNPNPALRAELEALGALEPAPPEPAPFSAAPVPPAAADRGAPSAAPAPAGPVSSPRSAAARPGSGVGGPPAAAFPTTPAPMPPAARAKPRTPSTIRGEQALEAMAREQNGAEKKGARPWVTLGLFFVLAAVTVAVFTWRSWEKARLEAIDALLTEARPAFDRDTAEGYALAADGLETILAEHDPKHPEALARLTHALAILWAEHGEEDRLVRLGQVAALAKEQAADESDTWAGVGLQTLEAAPDRVEGAAAARAAMQPFASRFGDGTAVDLVLGQAEMAEGEYDAAFESMERVQRSGRMRTRTSVLMAIAARKAGRFGTAKSLLDEALRTTPDHPRALATLASLELRQNRVEAAKKVLEQFEKVARRTELSSRTRAAALYARSEYFRRTGQEARAEGLYREAVELDPRNADFPHGLGRWQLLVGRPKEAIDPLERAVALEPGRYAFLVDLAEAEMNLRRFEAANAHIDRALQLEPDFLPALLAKGRSMRRTGDPGTEAYLRQLLDERPSAKVELALELGRWFRSRDRFERSQAELEDAIASMGGRSKMLQAEVVLSYGRLMEDMGQVESAQASYARAAEFGDPEGWYRLSAAAYRASQPELAKKACTRYLKAGQGLRYARNAQAICDRL